MPFEPPSQHDPSLEDTTSSTQTPVVVATEVSQVERTSPWNPFPWLHVLLFLGTLGMTMYVGSFHYASFAADFTGDLPNISFIQGAWYSLTILAILGTHEFGHYFACRYYRLDATLPYFLPAPLPLTGTVGAVIRILEPIRNKPMLFDIGAAGPIAGFVVALPALFIGLSLSRLVVLPEDFVGMSLGEPLLFQFAASVIWGDIPEGYTINLHPMALAAWIGLLITALNLFPIGQLDGGHIAYAALGARATSLSFVTAGIIIGLAFFSSSWILWAILMVTMLIFLGARHPKTPDEHVPLDPTRRWLAIATAVIFALCFTPAPIEVMEILTTP